MSLQPPAQIYRFAPDLGAIFRHDESWGVVVGWLKRDPQASDFEAPVHQMLWCGRAEAECVVGRGDRYVVCPVSEAQIIGNANLDVIALSLLRGQARMNVGRSVAETLATLQPVRTACAPGPDGVISQDGAIRFAQFDRPDDPIF